MTLYGAVRRVHIWVGLLLGVQILLWMASGVVMSWYSIGFIRGEHTAPVAAPLELNPETYASPGGVIAQLGAVHSLELRTLDGRPVYETKGPLGPALFDARSGDPVLIDEALVNRLARSQYVGEGALAVVEMVDDPGIEYRGAGPLPVWRAQFDDKINTRLYISPATGEIVRRRNDAWLFYDFFWMLHIMDYTDRSDFNSPLLKTASAAGLIFSASGLAMLFFRSSRKIIASDVRRLTGRRANQDSAAS
ncbi:MAG: PepSY domain-containing protein [Pseudomonadota bacterium]